MKLRARSHQDRVSLFIPWAIINKDKFNNKYRHRCRRVCGQNKVRLDNKGETEAGVGACERMFLTVFRKFFHGCYLCCLGCCCSCFAVSGGGKL